MGFSQSRNETLEFINWYFDNVKEPDYASSIIERAGINGIPDWKMQQVSLWMVKNGLLRKYRVGMRVMWRRTNPTSKKGNFY